MEDCSRIPANCIISGILRKSEVVLPRGATVLEEGDDQSRPALAKLLGRPGEAE